MLLLNSATSEWQPADSSIAGSWNAADAANDPLKSAIAADDGSDRSEPPDAPTVHEPDQPAEPRSFAGSFTVTFFNIKIK